MQKRTFQHTIINLGPSIVWALVILKLLLSVPSEIPKFPFLFTIPHFDKWAHAILFGVWMATLLWASARQFESREGWKVAFLLVLLMGVGTEVLQETIIEKRTGDVLDFAADIAGAGVFFLLLKKRMEVMIVE